MTLRRILATGSLAVALLGSPLAAARYDLGGSLAVFFGGIFVAATVAFWPVTGSPRGPR